MDTGGKRRKRNKCTKPANPMRKERVVEKGMKEKGWTVGEGCWVGGKRGHSNTQLNKGKQNNKNSSSSREIVLIRSLQDKVTQRKKNARNCYNLWLQQAM